MTEIFKMKYRNGQTMEVYQDEGNADRLYIRNASASIGSFALHLSRAGVKELHRALGRWLSVRDEPKEWMNRNFVSEDGSSTHVSLEGRQGKITLKKLHPSGMRSEFNHFLTPEQVCFLGEWCLELAKHLERKAEEDQVKAEKIQQIQNLMRELGNDSPVVEKDVANYLHSSTRERALNAIDSEMKRIAGIECNAMAIKALQEARDQIEKI